MYYHANNPEHLPEQNRLVRRKRIVRRAEVCAVLTLIALAFIFCK